MPDYYYDSDNNKYYKEISKKDFLILLKYKLSDFNKLKNSIYPYHGNNFILLKIPSWYQNDNETIKKEYFPCDYKLANFIKFLWKYKMNISHSCYQPDKFNNMGYITITNNKCIDNKCIDNNEIINVLDILFGKDKIIIINYIDNPKPKRGLELMNYHNNILKKYKNKIICCIFKNYIRLYFNNENLKWIHKKLDISIPKKNESLKGSIIKTMYNMYPQAKFQQRIL